MSEVTHYWDNFTGELLCRSRACRIEIGKGLNAGYGKGSDYADIDQPGRGDAECCVCGEDVFPEEAEEIREHAAYMEDLYYKGRLHDPRAVALEQLREADPVQFYIECKDNPDAIEARLDAMP